MNQSCIPRDNGKDNKQQQLVTINMFYGLEVMSSDDQHRVLSCIDQAEQINRSLWRDSFTLSTTKKSLHNHRSIFKIVPLVQLRLEVDHFSFLSIHRSYFLLDFHPHVHHHHVHHHHIYHHHHMLFWFVHHLFIKDELMMQKRVDGMMGDVSITR